MTTGTVTRAALARIIDHTLLAPEATAEDVVVHCEEAAALGVAAVCVSPTRVALAVEHAGGLAVSSVVGFPSGAHLPAVKAQEAAGAVEAGAQEIDMVIDLGKAREGHWSAVESEIGAVRQAVPAPTLLKVIIESAVLAREGIVAACQVAEAAGADVVKTSTGFHRAGGASLSAVRLMSATVGGRLGVKASGGVRTTEQALAFVAAGATRLGLSATAAVLADLPA